MSFASVLRRYGPVAALVAIRAAAYEPEPHYPPAVDPWFWSAQTQPLPVYRASR